MCVVLVYSKTILFEIKYELRAHTLNRHSLNLSFTLIQFGVCVGYVSLSIYRKNNKTNCYYEIAFAINWRSFGEYIGKCKQLINIWEHSLTQTHTRLDQWKKKKRFARFDSKFSCRFANQYIEYMILHL